MIIYFVFFQRFFSITRSACGNNSHPSSVAFAQAFRLLSVYSLIKPPGGSNVDPNESVVTLLKPEDLKSEKKNTGKQKLISQLEAILERQATSDDYFPLDFIVEPDGLDSACKYTSDEVKAYVSGFVARRTTKFTKCDKCIDTTTNEINCRDKLITLKTRGKLLTPSENLYKLIAITDDLILQILNEQDLSTNLLLQVFDGMEGFQLPRIGCENHDLRAQILSFFLIFRMNTICNHYTEIELSSKRENTQMHAKIAKLQ